jgi:hypothetical protein
LDFRDRSKDEQELNFRYIWEVKFMGLENGLDEKMKEKEVMNLISRFLASEIGRIEKMPFTEG